MRTGPTCYNRDVMLDARQVEYPWMPPGPGVSMIPFAEIDPDYASSSSCCSSANVYASERAAARTIQLRRREPRPRLVLLAGVQDTGGGACEPRVLSRCFQKLILNFTWWVNRKDRDGKHLFAGGFLGLDNIGVFDRF